MINVPRWVFAGRVFMSAAVLLAVPTVVAGLASGFQPPQVAVAFGLLSWAAIWIWLWMRACGRDHTGEVVGLIAITILLLLFTLIEPLPAGTILVFCFIVAGVIFPLRRAVWAVALLLLLQGVFLVIRLADPAAAVNGLLNSILVGGVAIGGRLLWQSYAQLLAAREEIGRLAVSEERLRFARDLHDILGQSLSVVVLKSELVAKQLPPDTDDSLRQELRDVARVARKSLNDVREAAAGYRRPSLGSEVVSARSALRAAAIGFQVEDDLGRVPAEQDAVLAWCLREAVTNVLKHSGARKCVLRLTRDETAATLEIVDDGRGATVLDGGTGLTGVRERVELAGGRLEIGPDAGAFRLAVTLPAGLPLPSELAVT